MFRLFRLFWEYNLPRWSILIIDTIICAFALGLAFLIRFYFDNDNMAEVDRKNVPIDFAVVLSVRLLSFFLSKPIKGLCVIPVPVMP